MISFINRRQFIIEWGHCDVLGNVFDSRFFEFFDQGTWLLFEAALGVKPQHLAGRYGIVGIPLVDASARFIAQARFGDVVDMTSRVRAFRRSSFDVEHRLAVDGAVVVEGVESRVWAVGDPRDAAVIRSAPVPQDVVARFQAS